MRQIPGWRTNRKLIVIESDDWGSIRMPSREVYQKLLKEGVRVDKCPYNRYDALESENDLTSLFEVLNSVKDVHGNSPVITANSLLVNPDFKSIKASGFQKYEYELVERTYEKYPAHSRSFEIIKQGMDENIFYPQFHGREHLNVTRWMKGLSSNFPETRMAFDSGLFGISTNITSENRRSYMEALSFEDPSELVFQKQSIKEGLILFERLYGFKSRSFIAPSYAWHTDLDPVLSEMGIRYFQGKGYRKEPRPGKNIVSRQKLGEKNGLGQTYLRRNCFFEPSYGEQDWVDSCLAQISRSFMWKKPAIIQSHRLNFIGFIDRSNSDRNLLMLKNLLKAISTKWPDAEYLTTSQLGDIIS